MKTTAKELARWGWMLRYKDRLGERHDVVPRAYILQRATKEPEIYCFPLLRKEDTKGCLSFRTFRESPPPGKRGAGKVMVEVFDESEAQNESNS